MTRTKERQPSQIQDTFLPTDNELYVYTSWVNVRDRSRYGIKIYDARGVLFYESEKYYRFGTQRWNLWDSLLVKGWPAARLPGKWQAKISMDGVLAKTKEFFVGSENRRCEQTIKKDGALSIGVYPFFVDTESTYGATFRANDSLLPLYLSQMLTIDFEAHRVVMPFELRKGTANPKVKKDRPNEH